MIPNHDRPKDPEHCFFCYLYWTNDRYRELIDQDAAPFSECRHRAGRLSLPVMTDLGLDPRREWHLCALGRGLRGGAVCSCEGCGPKCADYSPDD